MSDAFATLPVGDHGVLLELGSNTTVHAVAATARRYFGDQLAEVVPGHRTLLLVCHPGSVMPDLSVLTAAAIASTEKPNHDGNRSGKPRVIRIPVRYDGGDLMAITRVLCIDRERVIELHCGPAYTVAFMGFAPGFPYLVGLPRELQLPRLEVPRVEVPAGSVAVASGYCGIYPRSSPGGWNLLGRTNVPLFDPTRDPPAFLAPGDQVRFEPV
jgi:KipI family sensor histidine kinase inhibitor